MNKFSYPTIVIGTTCLLAACLAFGLASPAATQVNSQSQSQPQASNAKSANRQRIPANEMRRVTSAEASGSTATTAPLAAPESKSSDSKQGTSKRATTKRIGSDHSSEQQRANFQVRMMHAQQAQQVQSQQQQQQQQQQHHHHQQQPQAQLVRPHSYFMNPPDSWQPQGGLISSFGDQESNDELAASLTSEIDATESQLKQAKLSNMTASPAALEVQKYRMHGQGEPTVVSALSLESRRSREKQQANESGNSGKRLGAGLSSKDDYYGPEEDEDEEPEPSAVHQSAKSRGEYISEQQPRQQPSGPAQDSSKVHGSASEQFRAMQEGAEGQYGDYAAGSEEGYRRQAEVGAANRTNAKSTGSDNIGWAPSSSTGGQDFVTQGQAASQQQEGQKQPAPTTGETEKVSEFLSGGPLSKADVAIEYIRNILKSKQSSLSSGNSTTQLQQASSSSSSVADGKPQSDAAVASSKSLLRLSSFASRLNQILNNTVSNLQPSDGDKVSPSTPLNDQPSSSKQEKQSQPQQIQSFSSKSFLTQQDDAKFSIGDVKPAASDLEPMYQISQSQPASSSAPADMLSALLPDRLFAPNVQQHQKQDWPQQQSLPPQQQYQQQPQQSQKYVQQLQNSQQLPRHPLHQQYQQQQHHQQHRQQQHQQAAVEEVAHAIANGAPLGGEYVDNLDDIPHHLQQQLYGISDPIERQISAAIKASSKPDQHLQSAPQPNQQQLALAHQGGSSIRDSRQHQEPIQLPGQYEVAYQQSTPDVHTDPRFNSMQRPPSQPAPGYLFSSQNLKPYSSKGGEGQGQKQTEHQVPQSQQTGVFDSYAAQQPVPQHDVGSHGQPSIASQSYTVSSGYNRTDQLEKVDQESQKMPHNPKQLQPQNEQQQLSMISSKLYKQEHQIPPRPAAHPQAHQSQSHPNQMPQVPHHHQQQQFQPAPSTPPPQQQQQQQPVAIKTIEPPIAQAKVQPQPQQYQRFSKTKPPKIVSYNHFDSSANEQREHSETIQPGQTNYQLGDALYGSNGGLEQALSQAELEAIQNQFLTAEHPVVTIGSEYPGQQTQQQQLDAAALAAILSGLKPGTIPADMLQRLTSPGKQAEEVLKELASNDELTATMVPAPPSSAAGVPVAPLTQSAIAQVNDQRQHQQQQKQSQPEKQEKPQSQLEQEEEQTRKLLAATKSAGINSATDFDVEMKKKSLIVYLNHPRPIDMSKVGSSAQESYTLAQTVANEQSVESFISAKEFDLAHGLSKDSKQLDISNLGEIKDGQDKDGLSVVVIGDAYKYKKIVLLISSKSGGLKFIPMVKDMKK